MKPSELFFLLSRTSELNIEAATEDRLVCEPDLVALSSLAVEVVCVLVTLSSVKFPVVSVRPELEG